MKSFCHFAILLAVFFVLQAAASPPPGYYLVWGDEFNGTSLDPTKWWVWNQPDRSGYSTPDAVTEGGGYMTITTYTTNGAHYSGIVSSDARFRERFGYTEASVEFNGSPGMFSDFWVQSATQGEFIGDPAASGTEIDVCEHRVTDANDADNITGQVTIDLHWDGYGSSEKSATSGLIGSGLGMGFHTYGLLWNSTNYAVSFDGAPVWSTNVGISDRTEIIMFSSEVDSNSFCGIVPPAGYGNFLVSTTTTVVDYVRFYAPTTTVYWIGTSSANWNDEGNWLSNMVPASTSDAVFSYLSVGDFSINLGQPTTVNSLSIEEAGPIGIFGDTLTVGGGGIDMLSAIDDAGIYVPLVVAAPQSWNVGSGFALVVDSDVSGSGNITMSGQGTVLLDATNDFSGTMIVSNGALQVTGWITNPVTVAGGTLYGSGSASGPIVVDQGMLIGPDISGLVTVDGGVLGGTETITGPVVVNVGGTLAPGSPPDTLTISNSLTLQPGSSTLIDINKSAGTCDQVVGLTSITYGGTLIISNLAGTLSAGDSFNIFSAARYSGQFNRISPASPGSGLAWDTTSLNTGGTLRVITTSNAVISAQWNGQRISLSWPATNIGWFLQSQTNPPGIGLTTQWTTIPGTDGTNAILLTINPAVGSVFFRLAAPASTTAIFGTGDLIVLQVGNGSISSSGAPGFLNDYSTLGGPKVVQVALPTTGTSALLFGGSSYDGVLSLAGDGRTVIVEGYNVSMGSFSGTIDSSSSGTVPRAVGSMNAQGVFTLNATTANFSGSTIRSAVSDGSGNFWAGGGSSGIVYLGNNSSAATLSTVSTSTRDLAMVNGRIFFTQTGSGQGVMGFAGSPVAASAPTTILSTAGTGSGTPSPKGFAFNSALTIAYVADNRTNASGGGLQRFNWNGSAFSYAYTLENTVTSSKEVEDIAVNFSGANPVIYAVTGESTANNLITVSDTGASSKFSVLETAPSGDAFRGVTFAPSSP